MPNLRWQELLIIVALVLLLFGAKRLPDAARGLGRSLRIFKAETKGLVDGDEGDDTQTSSDAATPQQPSSIESGEANQASHTDVGSPSGTESSEAADRSRSDG